MNLRKALDRAKQERQQASPEQASPDGHATSPATTQVSPEKPSHNKKQDVVIPIHSESRHVILDPEILRKNRCVSLLPDAREGELYKVIRTQIIQRMQERQWNTLLITSALQGEGKSVTSINLASTFAKELNQTVLLVDGDLRRQDIHKYLGYESKEGLVDYLRNDTPLHELIVWPGIEKLSIISGGEPVPDSTELLGSQKMKALLVEMKNRYKNRYILLESPPLLACPDTAAFAPFMDAIVMVVEAGRTSIDEVKKSLELIPKEKFLGFILNKKDNIEHDYYTGYSYA